jgi:hypothetical protein
VTQIVRKTRVIEGVKPDAVPYDQLMTGEQPVILKGLVKDWPLVQMGSPADAAEYLKSFYQGRPVTAFIAQPEHNGRFGYTADATQLDFESDRGLLNEYLDIIIALIEEDEAPTFYIGSTDVDTFLPGFRAENDLVLNHAMFETNPPLVGAWIGNRSTALAHYDMSNNIACCLAGRRRFTLFPPEQIHNLYPGPLEPTPGGQVLTMADINAPDFERFPGLGEALAAGEVEALDDFNVMVNYWWNTSPDYLDTPQNTLLHALLSLRDRPEQEKSAWRSVFDYYVFGPAERAAEHLPEAARGNLGTMDELKARRLRAYLLQRLNR